MTKSFIEEVREYTPMYKFEGKMAEKLIAIGDELTKMEEGGNWQRYLARRT